MEREHTRVGRGKSGERTERGARGRQMRGKGEAAGVKKGENEGAD